MDLSGSTRLGYSLIFLLFLLVVTAQGHSLQGEALMAHYDSIEAQSISLAQWKSRTNDNGSVAWNTSYLLDSYICMYEVTGDHKYLDKFVELADSLADGTDVLRGTPDYKGRRRVGWGSVAYSRNKERVVWLVHTGMITYPLLRFASLVKDDAKLRNFVVRANKYQAVSEAALKEFDDQWHYDPKTREGYYVFENDQPLDNRTAGPDTPLPFNMQLAAGRSFIVLTKLTNDFTYHNKAEGLARHFRNHLTRESDLYVWKYWYGNGLIRSGRTEDVSHGALDVDFAVLAEQNSIVFTPDDLMPFVPTFLDHWNREHSSAGTR